MAVHARPAAFEAADGTSYSAEIVTDPAPQADSGRERTVSGYLLFVRWRAGDPVASGHVETEYLATGTEQEVLRKIGALTLQEVRALLNSAVTGTAPSRPWWDAMREEGGA